MTARRTLGTGPQAAHTIREPQADLVDALPGIHLPDVTDRVSPGAYSEHPLPATGPRSRP